MFKYFTVKFKKIDDKHLNGNGAGLDWYNGLRRIKCGNGDWGNGDWGIN